MLLVNLVETDFGKSDWMGSPTFATLDPRMKLLWLEKNHREHVGNVTCSGWFPVSQIIVQPIFQHEWLIWQLVQRPFLIQSVLGLLVSFPFEVHTDRHDFWATFGLWSSGGLSLWMREKPIAWDWYRKKKGVNHLNKTDQLGKVSRFCGRPLPTKYLYSISIFCIIIQFMSPSTGFRRRLLSSNFFWVGKPQVVLIGWVMSINFPA